MPNGSYADVFNVNNKCTDQPENRSSPLRVLGIHYQESLINEPVPCKIKEQKHFVQPTIVCISKRTMWHVPIVPP